MCALLLSLARIILIMATSLPAADVAVSRASDVSQGLEQRGPRGTCRAPPPTPVLLEARIRRSQRKCGIPKKRLGNFRDLPWLLLFILTCAFFMTVAGVAFEEYDAPSPYECDSCEKSQRNAAGNTSTTDCGRDSFFSSLHLDTMRERETCIRSDMSFFDTDKDLNVAAGKPEDCWGLWDPETETWLDSRSVKGIRWQQRNSTWHAEDHCVMTRNAYHLIVTDGNWWQLALVCLVPFAFNLVTALVLAYFPAKFYSYSFGTAMVSLVSATAVCIWKSSLWGILWGFSFALIAGLYFALRSTAKLNAEIVVTTVGMLMGLNMGAMLLTVAITALLIFGGGFAWILVAMRLNGRLSVITDAFLFITFIWLVGFFKSTLIVAGSQVAGTWYYRHLDVRQPLLEGFTRAASINAGSVALGSLFGGITKVLQISAGFLRTRVSGSAQFLAVIASILEVLLRALNQYGYSFLIFSNTGFTHASLEGLLLLTGTNIALISSDAVIFAIQVAGGVATGTMGVGVAYFVNQYFISADEALVNSTLLVYLYLPAFLFGFIAGLLPAYLLEGGANTIYLGFAEDPMVLEETDNNLYLDLLDAWQLAMEEQHVMGEELGPEDLELGSNDGLSESSFGESEVDEEEMAQLPNQRLRNWRKQLTAKQSQMHQGSLFARKNAALAPGGAHNADRVSRMSRMGSRAASHAED